MTLSTLEQTNTSLDTSIQQDPWQSARVFQYFDTVTQEGGRVPGLVDQMWHQVAMRLDIHNALQHSSYQDLLAQQTSEAARVDVRQQIEARGDLFDHSMLQYFRSICLGAAAYEDYVIVRATSEGLETTERLGGWEYDIADMVDHYARNGLARQLGFRIERSRLENGIIAETSITDSVAARY